jgi:glycosyltransferase involved in cell wall biosynthesis
MRRYWHGGRHLQYRRAVAWIKAPHGPWERTRTEARAAVSRERVWRAYDPVLWDLELAYGPVIDRLQPDLIHANDFRMSGVAIRAKMRALRQGRDVKVVYDVHEFVPGVRAHSRRWQLANQAHEREYIGRADAVLTVSDRLAAMLQERYRLPERPRVVLNAPQFDPDVPPVTTVRGACGLDASTPLLVYAGGSAVQRGLMTMVDALPRLPAVHVAFVVAANPFTDSLVVRAAQLGVADRVHVLPYVPQDQVVPFLSDATAGVIPIHHFPNHEIALITKYFEYAHARLPIVVSDVETMAGQTRELGNGEVFRAEDVADYVRAVEAVLADRERYARIYDERPEVLRDWSWRRQADVLTQVYAQVTGITPPPRGCAGEAERKDEAVPEPAGRPEAVR